MPEKTNKSNKGKKLGPFKQPKVTEEMIEKALRKSGGFISRAAKLLNITQSAVTHRVQRSKDLQKALIEIKEAYLDTAENALHDKIKEKDLGAICFYLKCQGKDRGYVEKQVISGEVVITHDEWVRRAKKLIAEKTDGDE